MLDNALWVVITFIPCWRLKHPVAPSFLCRLMYSRFSSLSRRFTDFSERVREQLMPRYHEMRQLLMLRDAPRNRTGIMLRTALKEIVESYCGVEIRPQVRQKKISCLDTKKF